MTGGDVPTLADAAALAEYLARPQRGSRWRWTLVSTGGPPVPFVATIGLYHPAAG